MIIDGTASIKSPLSNIFLPPNFYILPPSINSSLINLTIRFLFDFILSSRRRPVPLTFDPLDPTHRSFVLWAAVLRGRVCGISDLRSPTDTRLVEAFLELGPGSLGDSIVSGVSGESVLGDLLVKMGPSARADFISSLCPEEFEKDDAELGHVDFATVAANLR